MAMLRDPHSSNQTRPRRRFGFRIGLKTLSQMCHQVGTGLRTGVDIRQIWQIQSSHGNARHRAAMLEIRGRVADGQSVTEAVRAMDGYFPELLREMVDVGERTGRLDQIFTRLGEHYDTLLRLRRAFLIGIAWPTIELSLAIAVMALFIWILGLIGSGTGPPAITFFGLYGNRGLLIYGSIVGSIVASLAAVLVAIRNGWISLAPLTRLLIGLPGIGRGLQIVAISRLTWSLALASDSDIDAQRVLKLAVRTTQNSYYTSRLDRMLEVVGRGGEFHEAFASAGVFPQDFLGALQAGEISGNVSEAMEILAKDYEDRAKTFYRAVAAAAGVAVFVMVAAMIIFLIFSLFSQYLGILNEAGQF